MTIFNLIKDYIKLSSFECHKYEFIAGELRKKKDQNLF